jgi:single-stranded-DNA-specific exonuclease
MPEAVDRIWYAIRNQENIVVYGDYDADGVTATALLGSALKMIGGRVREYIPNRFDEGYGLNLDALQSLHQDGTNLIITVDCGIRSWEEADYSRSAGVDLIISDHHLPLDTIPRAFAVINPKQPGDTYPEKNLAGVGLAYKLAETIFLAETDSPDPQDFLDLVAIGTVTDMVPLTGENRTMVKKGLEYLRHPRRQGIMALIGVSGLTPARLTATDIGFALGPRINAAGRLDSALASLNLLTSHDLGEAGHLAQWLEIQNRERQKVTRQIQEHAENKIIVDDNIPFLLFAADESYNPGVVGLAASRLTDAYYRPSIVASIGEEFTRGSCRSIPEFPITEALDQCKELMEHHGGHAAAAGFTVRNDRLVELIEKMTAIANERLSSLDDLRPKIKADVEVPLSELKPDLLKYLDLIQPTGMGNPTPIFMSRGLKILRHKTVGADGSHLKLAVSDGNITYDAVAFRQGRISWTPLRSLPRQA